ncbi:MAG: MBL fold metallo-hydrolase, partial [Gemmatimonadales bacterium]
PAGASVSAELNGERFTSGSVVDRPGSFVLEVDAARGAQRATQRVEFAIEVSGDRVLIVRMFDLGPEGLGGGGDAILLSDSSSLGIRHGMVDAGPRGLPGSSPSNPQIIDEYVSERLQALGVDTLQFLQLTHAHADHFRGMADILRDIPVKTFLYNGQPRSFARYNTVLAAANAHADTVVVVDQEMEILLGGDEGGVRTVHIPGLPDYLAMDTNNGRLLNEGSLGTYVSFDGVRMFLTGDGEVEANVRWRTSFQEYTADIDILKVGHHGANNAIFDDGSGATNTASAWLVHTAPALMLIPSNGRSHPRVQALNRMLEAPSAQVFCTNVHGDLEVRIAGGWWEVTAQRNQNADCVPGDEART